MSEAKRKYVTFHKWNSQKKVPRSLSNIAEGVLEGSIAEGTIETLEETTRNNSRAIGTLLDVLLSKGVITTSEAVDVLGDCLLIGLKLEES